jgi:hypothetical protein
VNAKLFERSWTFYILTNNTWGLGFFHIPTNVYYSFFFFLIIIVSRVILVSVEWCLIVVLICIFLWLMAVCTYYLHIFFGLYLLPIFVLLLAFLQHFKSSLCIPNICPLSGIYWCTFVPACVLTFLMVSFEVQH